MDNFPLPHRAVASFPKPVRNVQYDQDSSVLSTQSHSKMYYNYFGTQPKMYLAYIVGSNVGL